MQKIYRSTRVLYQSLSGNTAPLPKSVDSKIKLHYTSKLVRSLTLLADAKLRTAQEQLIFARVAKNLVEKSWKGIPITVDPQSRIVHYIFSSDRKLAGTLNTSIMNHVRKELRSQPGKSAKGNVNIVGSLGCRALLHEFSNQINATYDDVYASGTVPFSESLVMTSDVINESANAHRIDLHYPHYVNSTTFVPTTVSIAGFKQSLECEALELETPNQASMQRNVAANPATKRNFWEFRLAIMLHQVHCDTRAVEASARNINLARLIDPKTLNNILERRNTDEDQESHVEDKLNTPDDNKRANAHIMKPRTEENKHNEILRRTELLRTGGHSSTQLLNQVLFNICGKDVL